MNRRSQRAMENLVLCELNQDSMSEYFPGATVGDTYEIHLTVNGLMIHIGWLLSADTGTDEQGLHIYVIPELRTPKYLRALVRDFEPILTKHLKSLNKRHAISICSTDDTKVVSLLKALKFKTQNVCLGYFTPKEELWEKV